MIGYWALVLHSHLPFVHHPDHEYFLEEHWLFEALSETYIPLLLMLEDLEAEGVYARITTSVTPPLAEMFANEDLRNKYVRYLDKLIEFSEKEIVRTKDDPYFQPLSLMYKERFSRLKDYFTVRLSGNILNGYRHFQDKGMLNIITCGATHGFLPFMTETAVKAQIEYACRIHEKHFYRRPEGIWLPECAYYDGADKILSEAGIKYFFVDSHGILYSDPRPKFGTYAPVFTSFGVAAFGRDLYSSRQVWSSKEGYPGDYAYRDFYRDAGYDLDFNYIEPYISPDGTRGFTGLKYHKITGNSDYKEAYNRADALEKTRVQAYDFVQKRIEQLKEVSAYMDRAPLIVSPYDAELFGHWWFEGPEFLANVFREIAKGNLIKPVTPMEYLNENPVNQVVQVAPSSWGAEGFYSVWLNHGNDWIYRHLRFMAEHMSILAEKYVSPDDIKRRLLNQMARELLLCQASDWAFLITTGTASDYSTERTREHINNFMRLYAMLEDGNVDFKALEYMEYKNDFYREIDYSLYRRN